MAEQFPFFDGPNSSIHGRREPLVVKEDVFVANLVPVGSLQETVNLYELLNAKDAKIAALDKENIVMRQQMEKLIDERDALLAILAPILAHAASHDYAPPIRFSVMECRDIKEKVDAK